MTIPVPCRMLAGIVAVALALHAASALAQTGSGGSEPLPNPVLNPGSPWWFEGFVVQAPAGEDWASFSKDGRSAELGRKYDDGCSAAIVIDSMRFDDGILREDDLLRVTRRAESTPSEPRSMKLLDYAQHASTPKGVLCVDASARFDDQRSQYDAPGTLVVYSRRCVRPDRPEIVVALRFAERIAQPDAAATLADAATAFFASLRFVPPPSPVLAQARTAIGNERGQEAIDLLQPAADEGDTEAALFLGTAYLYGSGIAADYDAARKYLELAAQDGRRDALYNLGAIYDKAIGVPRDAQQALKWFGLAADQRDAQAQLNLALLHLHGDGVLTDFRTAEQWLRRAAGNGSKRAQGILASGRWKPPEQ
ncbi:MAG: sel1 repeat family protein [Burkholderiales bacterium]|nr:sel1 repeat family protein [Burkholderiales bacterium]